ncbi:MAG TPA: hypothetical protein PL116_07445 [Candidatus Cloacimonas sp.]|nr:hypothetical protein [Candidatus Cloacimonas sp.]
MSKRKVSLVICCEDKQQECFARRFLKGVSWDYRQLFFRMSPDSKGSGEQWVREKFAKELNIYHTKQWTYAIIAIIDGDTKGVEGRITQFNNICREKRVPVRSNNDAVAIIVPTRNIETWIHYLNGETVDEETVYPKLKCESECQPAVENLVTMCKGNGISQDAPPSLHSACDEYRSRIYNFRFAH